MFGKLKKQDASPKLSLFNDNKQKDDIEIKQENKLQVEEKSFLETKIDTEKPKKISIKLTILFIVFLYFILILHLSLILYKEVVILNYDLEKAEKNSYFLELKFKEIENKKNRILSFDLETDYSITKFVNNKISFNQFSYIPENLISFSGTYITDAKGNGKLVKESMLALAELNKEFYKEFEENIVVVSSYRSYAYQKGIKDRGCPDNLCAKAGFSEHQSGLAVDFWETTTNDVFLSKPKLKKYFEWLKQNATKYGYHNTYQKGLEVDGYEIEPWHWRYLGVELATHLEKNNITFAEFYNKNNYGKEK